MVLLPTSVFFCCCSCFDNCLASCCFLAPTVVVPLRVVGFASLASTGTARRLEELLLVKLLLWCTREGSRALIVRYHVWVPNENKEKLFLLGSSGNDVG